jgi:hypothetical protein
MQPLTTINQTTKMETEITDNQNTPSSGSDAPTCSAYVVRGYALVPHEVEIWVEAVQIPTIL